MAEVAPGALLLFGVLLLGVLLLLGAFAAARGATALSAALCACCHGCRHETDEQQCQDFLSLVHLQFPSILIADWPHTICNTRQKCPGEHSSSACVPNVSLTEYPGAIMMTKGMRISHKKINM